MLKLLIITGCRYFYLAIVKLPFRKDNNTVNMNKTFVFCIFICMIAFLCIIFSYLGKKLYIAFKGRFGKLRHRFFIPAYIAALVAAIYFKTVFLATVLYSLIFYILADIVKLLFNLFKIDGKARNLLRKLNLHGFTALILAVILTVCAAVNCKVFRVTDYNIQINKEIGGNGEINIVMISDTHLGTSLQEKDIDRIVNKINDLNADLVCLCGDIIDESTEPELEDYAVSAFSRLKAKYGIFYINGNHERADDRERFGNKLKNIGINVLYDDYLLVDNRFYIVGRNNGSFMSGDIDRISMDELTKDIDKALPVILLDHDPNSSEENSQAGTDLQLSGHTHDGQLYPFNYIAALSNDYGYGHYNIGSYNIIVSSGIGTWGFPVRLGSKSEIVQVKLMGK